MALQYTDEYLSSLGDCFDFDWAGFELNQDTPTNQDNFVGTDHQPFHHSFSNLDEFIATPSASSSDEEVSSPASSSDESVSTSQSSSIADRVTIEQSFINHALSTGCYDEQGWIHFPIRSAKAFAEAVLQGQIKITSAGRKNRNRSKPRGPYSRMHDALHKKGWERRSDGKEWFYARKTDV